MSNKNPKVDPQNGLDEVDSKLTGLGEKVQNNPKIIVWSCIVVAAVVCIILLYVYAIRQPAVDAAYDALGQADISRLDQNDSISLEKYKAVAAQHGYAAGNLANLNAATILYDQGNYQEALKYLQEYEPSEAIIGASSKSLEGDCYVNLKQYPKAIECFEEAIKVSDDNPEYTPVFLMKKANVYREQKDYKNEADAYQQIIDNYPRYGADNNIDIEKYLARAQASK